MTAPECDGRLLAAAVLEKLLSRIEPFPPTFVLPGDMLVVGPAAVFRVMKAGVVTGLYYYCDELKDLIYK